MKSEKLKRIIGSKDLSSCGDIPAIGHASIADGCKYMTCTTEGDVEGGAVHFRTAVLHGYCAQQGTASSCSGSSIPPDNDSSSRHPAPLCGAASSLCGSSEPGSSVLRSASPRCFSTLQAPPLQHPASEYLLACECRDPEGHDAVYPNHPPIPTPQIASRTCASPNAAAAAADGSSQKAGTSPTGHQQRAGLATGGGVGASASTPAEATPRAASRTRLSLPLVPPRAEDGDAAKAAASSAAVPRIAVSPAAPARPGSTNLRDKEYVAAVTSPDSSSSPNSPDSVGQRAALPLPKAKRDARSASRAAASTVLIGKDSSRRLAGGKANAVMAGSSSSSGSEGNKPCNESNRLFFGLLHGRPRGYRELKRRSPKAISPSSCDISPAGMYTSWAPEPSSGMKDSPAGAARRSASSRSSRGAAANALDGVEDAGEDDSSSSCSPDSSYADPSAGPSKAVREQRTLQRAPTDADTAHTDRTAARSLLREAMHGVTLPPALARGYLREEETSRQPPRLQQLRQATATQHHPLQVTSAAAAAGDKVQETPESSANTNIPVGASGGPSTSDPSYSLKQQLEAQDTRLRDLMHQLSNSINHPTLQQLLKDSGWTQQDFARVDSFFDSVAEDSVYCPDFSSRTGEAHQLSAIHSTQGRINLILLCRILHYHAFLHESLRHGMCFLSCYRRRLPDSHDPSMAVLLRSEDELDPPSLCRIDAEKALRPTTRRAALPVLMGALLLQMRYGKLAVEVDAVAEEVACRIRSSSIWRKRCNICLICHVWRYALGHRYEPVR